MSFNVQDIVSSINKSGIAQSSHFTVQLDGPIQRGSQELMARADTVNLPGRSLMTTEHKFANYGPINKVPYGQLYGDSTITFLLSEDLREKDFFEYWQEQIINTGAYEDNKKKLASFSPESKWNVRYFHDYIGTVTIRQYGAAGNLKTIHKLQEAYPILLGDVAMGWGNGEPAKLTVVFAYKNYTYVTEDNSNQPGLGTGFSFNLGKDGLAGALRIPGFGNISSMEGLGTSLSGDFIGNVINGGINKAESVLGGFGFDAQASDISGGDNRQMKMFSAVNSSYDDGNQLRLPASGNAKTGMSFSELVAEGNATMAEIKSWQADHRKRMQFKKITDN